ncbi:MAG: hypothetical protein MZV64_00510 [Ignavibacteriales bacterium]|nr:hypothetical protein [Ignavibacteriales bacterium]
MTMTFDIDRAGPVRVGRSAQWQIAPELDQRLVAARQAVTRRPARGRLERIYTHYSA